MDALKAEVAGFTEILTKAAPGKWEGKDGKHVPKVSVADGKCTVVVPHGMYCRDIATHPFSRRHG